MVYPNPHQPPHQAPVKGGPNPNQAYWDFLTTHPLTPEQGVIPDGQGGFKIVWNPKFGGGPHGPGFPHPRIPTIPEPDRPMLRGPAENRGTLASELMPSQEELLAQQVGSRGRGSQALGPGGAQAPQVSPYQFFPNVLTDPAALARVHGQGIQLNPPTLDVISQNPEQWIFQPAQPEAVQPPHHDEPTGIRGLTPGRIARFKNIVTGQTITLPAGPFTGEGPGNVGKPPETGGSPPPGSGGGGGSPGGGSGGGGGGNTGGGGGQPSGPPSGSPGIFPTPGQPFTFTVPPGQSFFYQSPSDQLANQISIHAEGPSAGSVIQGPYAGGGTASGSVSFHGHSSPGSEGIIFSNQSHGFAGGGHVTSGGGGSQSFSSPDVSGSGSHFTSGGSARSGDVFKGQHVFVSR